MSKTNPKDLSGPKRVEHTMSDGRVVSVLEVVKNRHSARAFAVLDEEARKYPVNAALAVFSVVGTLDGRPVTFEELDEEPSSWTTELAQFLLPFISPKAGRAPSS